MTIIREKFISAPTITVPPGGILTAASITESPNFGWRNTDGLFPSWNCLDTLVPTTICPEPVAVTKEFNEGDWAPGFEFSAYGGTLCRLIGFDRDQAEEELRRVYLANESKGIERALLGTRFVSGGSGADAPWAAAVDLTPTSGVVSPQAGLAILEGYAGQVYAGVPTIHLPRTVASYLAAGDRIVRDGDRFFTRLDSKVVNGAGYEPSTGPDGTDAAAGEFWLYISGEVVIERGSLEVREATMWAENEDYILAERSYRAAVDCFTAAVRVEVY